MFTKLIKLRTQMTLNIVRVPIANYLDVVQSQAPVIYHGNHDLNEAVKGVVQLTSLYYGECV